MRRSHDAPWARPRTVARALTLGIALTIGVGMLAPTAVRAARAPEPSGAAPMLATIDTTGRRPDPNRVASLAARARREGRVRAIVGLRARIVPEASLDGPRAAAQRAEIGGQQARLARRNLARTGAHVVHRFRSIPAASVELTPAGLAALGRSDAVASVDEEVPMPPTLAQSVPLVRGDVAHALGFGGGGQAVAILDTGAELSHPFFAGRVVEQDCFSVNANCPNGETTMTGPGAAAPCTFAPSQCLHGTHVTGIAAGRHTASIPFDGVAPDASIVEMQIFSRFTGALCGGGTDPCALAWPTDQIAALERVYELRNTFSIASVNMSLGGGLFTAPCDIAAYTVAVANLRSAGIATVVAAGNDAATNAISAPGCVPGVVSVGSTTKADAVSSFSNSASFLSLLAPGSSITSSLPGGTTGVLSGTSMATPHVTGALAVLRQSAPTASVNAELGALGSTGVPVLDARNGITKPRIDVEAARDALRPKIVAGNAAVTEGNTGTTTLAVPVTLSSPSGATVSAHYQTIDAGATAPSDYGAAGGTVTFAPGATVASIPITVRSDVLDEADEQLLVALSGPVEGTIGGFFGLGAGTVVDDDPPPVVAAGVGSVVEGDAGTSALSVPVTLSAPSGQTVTVAWRTADASALAPGDYASGSGTLTFVPGDTAETISITVRGDTVAEGPEVLLVGLSSPLHAAIGGFHGLGFGVITDDD